MELDIKILKNGTPVGGVTGIIASGPGSWQEIAAVSNEEGNLSFDVDEKGTYQVQLFTEDHSDLLAVETGKTVIFEL